MFTKGSKFKPTEEFDGLEKLADVTFTMKAEDESNDKLMGNPNPNSKVNFVISAGDEKLASKEMKLSEVFESAVKFEWHDQKYQIKFK